MQQVLLILADGAEAVGGKLHILGGGVDHHQAASFPTNLNATIACSFLVSWHETDRPLDVRLRITDEDGTEILDFAISAVVGRPPHARMGQDVRSHIALRGPFPIPRPGGYLLSARLEGVDQVPPFRFWVDAATAPGASN